MSAGPGIGVSTIVGEPDPNCLHCYLFPLIDQWVKDHPETSSDDIVGAVAQVMGELIGSGCFNGGVPHALPLILSKAMASASATAADLLRTLNTRRQ